MSWMDRFTRLDPRERRLLTAFLSVFSALVLIVVPVVVQRAVMVKQNENELLRTAIDELSENQQSLLKSDAQGTPLLRDMVALPHRLAHYLIIRRDEWNRNTGKSGPARGAPWQAFRGTLDADSAEKSGSRKPCAVHGKCGTRPVSDCVLAA